MTRVSTLAALGAMLAVALASPTQAADAPRASISTGDLIGAADGGVAAF